MSFLLFIDNKSWILLLRSEWICRIPEMNLHICFIAWVALRRPPEGCVCCVRKIFVYLQPPPVKTKIGEYKESNNSGCQILLDIFIRNGHGHTSLVAFDYVRIRAQSLRTIRTFPTHLIRMRSDSELFRSFFLRMERQDKHLLHRFLSKSFLEI